jgi:hypothetical protein
MGKTCLQAIFSLSLPVTSHSSRNIPALNGNPELYRQRDAPCSFAAKLLDNKQKAKEKLSTASSQLFFTRGSHLFPIPAKQERLHSSSVLPDQISRKLNTASFLARDGCHCHDDKFPCSNRSWPAQL